MAKLPEALREVSLAVLVLVQDDLADADHSRFTVAGLNLMRGVEIDHVLSSCGVMPVEMPIRRRCAEDDSRRGKRL